MRIDIRCGKISLLGDRTRARLSRVMPKIYAAMGSKYIALVQASVRAEQSPGGEKWAQLSESTARRKVGGKRRGYHPILRVSGRMTNLYMEIHSSGVVVGTNASYAPLHQFGGYAGRNHSAHVPARPWLFDRDGSVPDSFRDACLAMLERSIEECLS